MFAVHIFCLLRVLLSVGLLAQSIAELGLVRIKSNKVEVELLNQNCQLIKIIFSKS